MTFSSPVVGMLDLIKKAVEDDIRVMDKFHDMPKYEYRVGECMAIDNLTYMDENGNIAVMHDYFHDCVVMTEAEARKEAARLEDEVRTLEYGVSMIPIDKKFPTQEEAEEYEKKLTKVLWWDQNGYCLLYKRPHRTGCCLTK